MICCFTKAPVVSVFTMSASAFAATSIFLGFLPVTVMRTSCAPVCAALPAPVATRLGADVAAQVRDRHLRPPRRALDHVRLVDERVDPRGLDWYVRMRPPPWLNTWPGAISTDASWTLPPLSE